MQHCPSCNEKNELIARFCESCGTALGVPEAISGNADFTASAASQTVFPNCQKCDSTDLEPDGFCNQCGFRNPTKRDHFEQVINGDFVAVSDRGIKHSQNEDCFAIQQLGDGRSVVVVCDGVSSSSNPGIASQQASQTACRSIQQSLEAGIEPNVALREAIAVAQSVVAKLVPLGRGEPPSTTIVAAIVLPSVKSAQITQITLAWLGDSRAYWFGDSSEQSQQLTQDHSWCEDMVATGQMSREEAERSLQAHAITRWLGADADGEMEPSIARFDLPLPGRLLLCSDGLWNYASEVSKLQESLHQPDGTDLITIARKGIEFALRCGGQDNITIALLDLKEVPQPQTLGEEPTTTLTQLTHRT
jgi:PPM family protein phosphatase